MVVHRHARHHARAAHAGHAARAGRPDITLALAPPVRSVARHGGVGGVASRSRRAKVGTAVAAHAPGRGVTLGRVELHRYRACAALGGRQWR